MTFSLLLPKLFLAGGAFLGSLEIPASPELMNHTLPGEKIPAAQVVCRSRWGTPMPPDGKAGYSLIAPYKYTPGVTNALIKQSLWIPPVSGTRPVAEAPAASLIVAAPAATPAKESPTTVIPSSAVQQPAATSNATPAASSPKKQAAPAAAEKASAAPEQPDGSMDEDSSESADDSDDAVEPPQ